MDTLDLSYRLAVSLVGAAGDLSIFSGQVSGAVHVIVDVNGYFQ